MFNQLNRKLKAETEEPYINRIPIMEMVVQATVIDSNASSSPFPDEYQTIFNSSFISSWEKYFFDTAQNNSSRSSSSSNNSQGIDFNFNLYLMIYLTRNASLMINCVLIVVGVLVNMLVILVFCRGELRKLTISIYTLSLAVSDMSLLSVPVFLKWLNELRPELALFKTSFWCKTHGYFDIAFCCWSGWNIVALSSERWMVICRPSKVYINSNSVHRPAVLTVVLIPFVSLLAFMWYPFMLELTDKNAAAHEPFVLAAADPDYYNQTLPISKDEIFCRPSDKHFYLASGIVSITISYLVPFLLIAFFNLRIVNTLNKRINKRKEYFGKSLNFKVDENSKVKKRRTQSAKGNYRSYFLVVLLLLEFNRNVMYDPRFV